MKKTSNNLQGKNIYQIYPRCYGSFDAISKDLPRIKNLGIDIIYLMPIQKIGTKNKKGNLGSPYAIYDYFKLNPEFITKDGESELKNLVQTAHSLELKVILGFVGGHMSADNVLLKTYPEWFFYDSNNSQLPPDPEWSDTADLKYGAGEDEKEKPKYENPSEQKAMWDYMTSVLTHYIKEYDFDGYRCDFAHFVPLDFWRQAIQETKKIKPNAIFIAEAYKNLEKHFKAGFDAVYAYETYNALKENNLSELKNTATKYGENTLLRYTENHDEARTPALFITLAPVFFQATLPGAFLLYNGQEFGEKVRPPLFEGDRGVDQIPKIDFTQKNNLTDFYTNLLRLRQNHSALSTGSLQFLKSDNLEIIAYLRETEDEKILIAINFSSFEEKIWAQINFPLQKNKNISYKFYDLLTKKEYIYTSAELKNGLTIGLKKSSAHIFLVTEI